jgi:signal transduction histidine kinase
MADRVVHQIKTPMVPIQGLAQRLMDEGLTNSQRKSYLEALLRETRKVDRFLDGVTGLVEADNVSQQHRDVDAFVSEVVERLRPEASGKGVALRLNLEAEKAVYLDSELLRRALGHLLDNGINALPTGGEVHIATKRCAYPVDGTPVDGVCICVRDNGLGIDEAQLPDLFKPFMSGSDRGLGLGLATAYRTVRAHGGLLLAHNPPEGGAAFTLFLPDFPELPDAPRRPNRK